MKLGTNLKVLLAVAALVGSALAYSSPATASVTTGVVTTTVTGTFTTPFKGTSVFQQRGNSIRVRGSYTGLTPGQAYFTVVYGNSICDPAQAFPVGPFIGNSQGGAQLAITVNTAVKLGAPTSVSVRYADAMANGTPTDLDGDGLIGTTDVVAVPGQPSIGLVACDSAPKVTTG